MVGCAGNPDDDSASSERRVTPDTINGFIGGASEIDTGGLFTEPSDLAIYAGEDDGPGDDKIFVAEADEGRSARVQRLDSHGNFELAWGQDVVRTGSPADTGTEPEICRQPAFCKAAPPGSAAGAFRQPTGIAVNNETGHVYVADTGNLRVQEFTLDGRFVRSWGWGVATGAAAFEICTADCRTGRHGKREGDYNPGQFAPVDGGGIAIRPGAGDVFVSDGGNNRVLQFTSDGDFIRAWGLGVASGDSRFETCTSKSGCRAGIVEKSSWVASGGWPRQLAVDDDGIVYATDNQTRSRLLRFDANATLDEVATDSLLRPIPSGHQAVGDDNMGVEVDSGEDRLVAVWNRFGPAVVDLVTNPGTDDDSTNWANQRVTLPLDFVQSAYGVGISPSTGLIYIAKSERLNRLDPSTSFTVCPVPGGGTRNCHGLIVMAAGGRPRATIGQPVRTSATTATLTGTVSVAGAATYRFQTSKNGGRWRNVHSDRYLTYTAETVRATVRGLKRGARYRVRILLTRMISKSPNVEHVASGTANIAG
jgi:DNA-binding beta-propeller fold protein YncE